MAPRTLLHWLGVAVTCVLYMWSGSWLILANQRIMNELGFNCPIILSALGTVTSAVTTRLAVCIGLAKVGPEAMAYTTGRLWYVGVFPVAVAQATTLAFGNAAYMFLGVGFIQMLKACTPVVVLAMLAALRLESPTLPVIVSVGLITIGTVITAASAPEWNSTGIAMMVAATFGEALRVALTQFLLTSCNFTVLEGQYVLAPSVSMALFLAAAPHELPHALASGTFQKLSAYPAQFAVAAALGVAVNYLSYMVIKGTGALTMKVITTLRNIVLIVYGSLFLGEAISTEQGVGYSVALVGFVGYTMFGSKPSDSKELSHIKLALEAPSSDGHTVGKEMLE